jgi:hypothetical protein
MFKNIKDRLKYWYKKTVTHYKFKRYRKRADELHRLTGRRYFVVSDAAGGMVVVDNRYIDAYNKAMKGKAKKITIADLITMAYYATSLNNKPKK